jgi:hypothetical protein
VSVAAITLCVAFQRVFIVIVFISLSTQSGNLWIHPRMLRLTLHIHINFQEAYKQVTTNITVEKIILKWILC